MMHKQSCAQALSLALLAGLLSACANAPEASTNEPLAARDCQVSTGSHMCRRTPGVGEVKVISSEEAKRALQDIRAPNSSSGN